MDKMSNDSYISAHFLPLRDDLKTPMYDTSQNWFCRGLATILFSFVWASSDVVKCLVILTKN